MQVASKVRRFRISSDATQVKMSRLANTTNMIMKTCLCMSEVISSFKSSRDGSQVFGLLMLFLCVIVHTMWSGKSLYIPILCLSAFL